MKPFYVALTVAYCAGIFMLSSSSDPVDIPRAFPHMDKVLHAVLYAGLAGVVSLGIRRSRPGARPSVQFIAPALFATVYGMTDEFHQSFVPGRHCDPWDMAANMTGALLIQILLCGFVWRIWD